MRSPNNRPMEHVSRFIALHKHNESDGLLEGLEDAPPEIKRNQILQRVPGSDRAERIRKLGLLQFAEGDTVPAEENAFQRLGHLRAYIVNAPDSEIAKQVIKELEQEYYILPNISLGVPRPTLSSVKLSLTRRLGEYSFWPEDSGVDKAHENGISGGGVIVGVLDTGCDCDHQEFKDKRIDFRYVSRGLADEEIRAVRGFDTNGHGTHVCGIIAGQTVGIAPSVELMVASVIESETLSTTLERITLGLDWMLSKLSRSENRSKPAIINMSLGLDPSFVNEQEQLALQGIQSLIRTLVNDFDVLPVVAIGNDGVGRVCLPGAYDEVLAVGAISLSKEPAVFSGGGGSHPSARPKPDIAGYGVDIFSSFERDVDNTSWYARISGTSMAAPYVTGIAALIASANPKLQGSELRSKLLGSVKTLPGHDVKRVGAGLARFSPGDIGL